MERPEETEISDQLPVGELQAVFEREPVEIALCFGSQAHGRTHAHSDVDLAVVFANLEPGDEEYNRVFFRVYDEIATALDREDIDLVDLHTLPGSLAQSVLEEGVLLYGPPERLTAFREQLDTDEEKRSPRERLDAAIERMDQHLA